MILNLKQFNTHITHGHFKMESIEKVIDIVRPNVYMTSIDLKDVFYSIPIHPEHQKYLKLVVLSKIYQYTYMLWTSHVHLYKIIQSSLFTLTK